MRIERSVAFLRHRPRRARRPVEKPERNRAAKNGFLAWVEVIPHARAKGAFDCFVESPWTYCADERATAQARTSLY